MLRRQVFKSDENMSRWQRPCWTMAGLVCRFILLSAFVSLAQCSPIRATITPSTPSAFRGRNINMNCTLEGIVASDVSASNLSFSWTNPELNEISVTRVINSRTVTLTITRVLVSMSSSRISCRLGNYTLDEVAIVVDEPRFPNAPECIVYNWDSMTCSWEVDENETSTISLAYSRSTCRSEKYWCPRPSRERGRGNCTWSALDQNTNHFMFLDHCLAYAITNAFSVTALGRGELVRIENFVKPNPVRISVTSVAANYVDLSWSAPSDRKQINYRVAYESRFSNTSIKNTTATSITLSNLIPNTKYSVTIDCIPVIRGVVTGFWSDNNTTEFTTKTDVPGDSPSITPGGFFVIEHNASHRNIKLFFQPVDDFHSHGEVKGYRVRYSVGNSTTDYETPPDLKWSVDLALEMNSTYTVSMDMKTVVGYNESLTPKTIVIDRQSELPPFPKNFVVQTDDEGTYILSWTLVDQASSYTLYWCSSGLRQFNCMNPLDWKVLPSNQINQPNQTSYVLKVVGLPDLTVRFAISVESVTSSGKTVSSGMLIANCTFSKNKELKPPENIIVMPTDQNSVTVHLSRPDRTSSFDKCAEMAYASHYLISYWPENRYKKPDETVVESFLDSVVISGLEEGKTYEFQIQSLSENGNSSIAALIKSVALNARAVEENASPVAIVIALVVVVCVAICAIPVVVKLIRWWKKKWHIEVKTPPKYVSDAQGIADDRNGYSNFLRCNLRSNGQVQTTLCESGHKSGYFNSALFHPGDDECLLSKYNSGYKWSSSSSSQVSPVPSTQSSSASSQSSDTRRDSVISASISGYNVVIAQPCENSAATPSGSGTSVPHDDTFVAHD